MNNSIFQYKSFSMVCEKTYQKGCSMPFRMNVGEVVFNQFQVESLELINNGIMLYHLRRRQVNFSENSIKSCDPVFEGFVLINQRNYKDVNILSNPKRILDSEKIFAPDLTG